MNELALLIRAIEAQEASYNPEMLAITQPFSSPGYHTTLTAEFGDVHKTRTAAYYGLALLDSGLEKYRERAYAVLERLVEAQDTNPEHKTFGIWPWFYEEPLEMMSPPDWNWADFIGKPLILALMRHSDALPIGLRNKMEQAVRYACQAIIRRNVGPHYTNIAIMGAFVTIVAGEWLGDKDVESYGLARLQRFYDYTMECGTFQEFNSPTYTTIAIEELSYVRTAAKSELAKELAERLLDHAWAMVAERFHPRTRQWAGPHTRAYSELLTDQVVSILQYGLNGRVTWLEESQFRYQTLWYGNDMRCPDHYVDHFVKPRTATLVQALLQEYSEKKRFAVTHLTEAYTLGTMSHGDLWNQRRSLMAYVDTNEGPVYIRLRALHDGYDYTGALLTAAQWENRTLFGVCFATNGGDRHPYLDPIQDGMIQASDLRLRFELGGAVDAVAARWEATATSESMCCNTSIGSIPLHIEVTAAAFADETIRYEVKREQGVVQVDVILYQGEAKSIALAELGSAIVAGQLALGATPLNTVTMLGEDECTVVANDTLDGDEPILGIAVPVRPAELRTLAEVAEVKI